MGSDITEARVWERWAVRCILAGFLVVTFQAIQNGTTIGQDMGTHMAITQRLWAQPSVWFTTDLTFRPLLYWVGGWCVWFTQGKFGYELASVIFTLAATGSLALLHDAERRVIASPALRVAGLALVSFLPLTVITTVVYAADTVVALPFVLAGWGVMRCLEAGSGRDAWRYAALGGLGFTLGNLSKATFLGLPAGIVFVLLALWRTRRITGRQSLVLLGFAVAVPCAVGGWIVARGHREMAGRATLHSFNWKGTGEMTLRSLAGVKASDGRIFNAPEYLTSEVRDGVLLYPMLLDNNYSYPALLHLGVFTDLLNFANHAQLPRPEPQRTAARWSVRLGLLFSLAALAGVLAVWLATAIGFILPARMPATAALLWSTLAMAWYAPIAAALPFVDHVYIMGYWLPRLVLPALWIFYLSGIALLDRLPDRWPTRIAVVVLPLVALLSALEIRSVWY